jgi:eukaryotic-like serine/threonine-protein kinase
MARDDMQLSGLQEPAAIRDRTDNAPTTSAPTTNSPHGHVAFEGYLVDRRRWLITHGGELIPLQRKAFDLLLYLLDHRDQVISKETLMGALWSNLVVEESNVTQQMFLLRRALSKHHSGIKIIQTIPGRGYRFVPSLEYPHQETAASGMFLHAHTSRVTMTISEETEDDPPVAVVVQRAVPPTELRWRGFLAVSCALFALGGYGLRCWQEHAEHQDDIHLVSTHQAVPAQM